MDLLDNSVPSMLKYVIMYALNGKSITGRLSESLGRRLEPQTVAAVRKCVRERQMEYEQ